MQPSLKKERPARPIWAISLLFGCVYLLLSLASYSRQDPSWNFAKSDGNSVANWGGLVGSWISDALLQSIGVVSYLLIAFGILQGLSLFRTKALLVDERSRHAQKFWQILAGIFLFCFSLTGVLSLTPFRIYSRLPLGGALGHIVARAGIYCFSYIGASLLLFGGLAVSLVLLRIPSLIRLPKIPAFPEIKMFESFKTLFSKRAPASIQTLGSKLDEFFKEKKPELTVSPPAAEEKKPFVFKRPSEPEVVTEEKKTEEAEPAKKLPFLSLFSKNHDEEKSAGDRVLLVKDALPSRKKNPPSHSGNYELPSLQLLDLPEEKGFEISRDELISNSKALEQKLLDFGVQGRVMNIRPGPIITLYEFEPAPGVKVKNIVNLTDDLKLAMKAVSIRIIAPIPGRAAVGIEIPNPRRQTVYLREILQSPLFQHSPSPLTLGMGKTTAGESYVTDLAKMPHLLIAGATGSGKSVGLNSMVVSMLFKATPEELKFIMIDPKMLELSVYEGIPHLLLPVVTDPKKAARALAWAVKEMERRYKLISSLGARNLKSYNEKVERLSEEELKRELELTARTEAEASALIDDEETKAAEEQKELALQEAGLDHYVKLPNIVIVIDELADLIMVAARDVEESIARLAQMARAAGIHLIIATQRPSVDVITGVIKANLPTRCAFQVASKVDSRTIIDGNGAENLIGDGDMLFLPPGTSRLERLHGPFISEDEIVRVVRHLKTQADPDYAANINLDEATQSENQAAEEEFDDDLYDQALQVVFETKSPSASMIQRRLRVGYNRAARMIERMEREGIVSAPLAGGKGREILVTPSYE